MGWKFVVGVVGSCLFLFIIGAAVISGGVMLLDSGDEGSLSEGDKWVGGDDISESNSTRDNGLGEYPDSYFEDAGGEDVKENENPLPPKDEKEVGGTDMGGCETKSSSGTETPGGQSGVGDESVDDGSNNSGGTTTFEPDDTEPSISGGSDFSSGEDNETSGGQSDIDDGGGNVNVDSDGDGIPDRVSGNYDEYGVLADSDPDRKDIFIEIDYMEGTEVPRDELDEMKGSFADAPVLNPDGSKGITVHFIYSDESVPFEKVTTIESYHNNQHQEEFDYKGMGVRHVLIVNDVSREDKSEGVVGGTRVGSDGVIVEDLEQEERMVATMMHELGHLFGLLPRYFDGIDSSSYSVDEYRSVMSYNYPDCYGCSKEKYVYSSGGEFDDWSVVEKDIAWFLETSELEK